MSGRKEIRSKIEAIFREYDSRIEGLSDWYDEQFDKLEVDGNGAVNAKKLGELNHEYRLRKVDHQMSIADKIVTVEAAERTRKELGA